MTKLIRLTILLTTTVLAGCQSPMSIAPKWPWDRHDLASPDDVPQQMICLWTDTVFSQPGRTPTRGFGGRVYFYNDRHQSMPVDGQLVVYAYDDSKEVVSRGAPDRRYVFTAEQLAKYYSESDLGHSYNIWIPWDNVGGLQREISLIPMFTDTQTGMVVQSKQSANVLPGEKVLTERERRGFFDSMPADRFRNAPAQGQNVQQVSYQAVPVPQSHRNMRTTTIQLPRGMASRWTQGGLATSNLSVAQVPGSGAPNSGPEPPRANAADPPINAVPQVRITGPQATPLGRPTPPIQGTMVHGTPLGQSGFSGDQQTTVSATARPWAREDARSAHFELPQFRAPASPGVRPGSSPLPSRFHPAR